MLQPIVCVDSHVSGNPQVSRDALRLTGAGGHTTWQYTLSHTSRTSLGVPAGPPGDS